MDQEELETFESAIEFYPKEVKEKILLNQRYNVPELTGLKRRLLVEKHTPYILFSEMLLDIISDLTVLIDNKMYPQQIFYFKKDICAFIYHSDENYLSVRESITQKLNLIFTGGVSDLEVTNKYKTYRDRDAPRRFCENY